MDAESQPQCGTCKFFRQFGAEPRGQCWLNPPTVFQPAGFQRRPDMNASGPASGCFQHQPGPPTVWGKANPETPGHAVKQAQQTKGGRR